MEELDDDDQTEEGEIGDEALCARSWSGLAAELVRRAATAGRARVGGRACFPVPGGPTLLGMDYRERITIEPGKRGGKPCIRGLRITVYDVLDYLAGGMTEDEILADFPDLEREDIRAVLAFAADRERRLVADPAA